MKTKITEKQLKLIIEERLNMQSTRRALEDFKLRKYDLNYFQSAEFGYIFSQWDDFKKKEFLILIGGRFDKVKDLIGKN